ncbi:hypothetical protein Pcinc_042205, partial [Petrolisthes cinctipes]
NTSTQPYPYLADPFDRKTTYKAMETNGLKNNNNNNNNNNHNNNKRQKSSSGSKTNEDVWGTNI